MISQAITSTLRFIITIQIYFSQASPHSMFYYIYLFAFIIISNSSRLPFVLAFRLFSFCFSCCLFIDFSLNDTLSPVISWSFYPYQFYLQTVSLTFPISFFLFVLYYSTFSCHFFISSSYIFSFCFKRPYLFSFTFSRCSFPFHFVFLSRVVWYIFQPPFYQYFMYFPHMFSPSNALPVFMLVWILPSISIFFSRELVLYSQTCLCQRGNIISSEGAIGGCCRRRSAAGRREGGQEGRRERGKPAGAGGFLRNWFAT